MNEQGPLENIHSQEILDYKTKNKVLSQEVMAAVDALAGPNEWSGQESYQVEIADAAKEIGYVISIRKGPDWTTIQKQASNNPRLVKTFYLNKKGEEWVYEDAYMTKYNESSLPELEEILNLLRSALEASQLHKLEEGEILE
jgi:hypothetical protein